LSDIYQAVAAGVHVCLDKWQMLTLS